MSRNSLKYIQYISRRWSIAFVSQNVSPKTFGAQFAGDGDNPFVGNRRHARALGRIDALYANTHRTPNIFWLCSSARARFRNRSELCPLCACIIIIIVEFGEPENVCIPAAGVTWTCVSCRRVSRQIIILCVTVIQIVPAREHSEHFLSARAFVCGSCKFHLWCVKLQCKIVRCGTCINENCLVLLYAQNEAVLWRERKRK